MEDQMSQITDHLHTTLTISHETQQPEQQDYDDDDSDDVAESGEFEFSLGETIGSPVSAEEVFLNGKIRPVFPFSGEEVLHEASTSSSHGPPVKRVFVSSTEEATAEEKYCSWAPEMTRKSNSTGFSRLRRVKDRFLVRSHSDGKDAFVFLNNNDNDTSSNEFKAEEKGKKEKKKKEKSGGTTSFGELHGRREKGGKGKKTYLPYRQDLLVGFFTSSVTGLTKNVHPY